MREACGNPMAILELALTRTADDLATGAGLPGGLAAPDLITASFQQRLTDRYQSFVIIALGESVAAIGATASARGLSVGRCEAHAAALASEPGHTQTSITDGDRDMS